MKKKKVKRRYHGVSFKNGKPKVMHWLDHVELGTFCATNSMCARLTVDRLEVTCKNCIRKWNNT